MNAIRKLSRSPHRNLQCYVRRYYGTTGSNKGADNKRSKIGNKETTTGSNKGADDKGSKTGHEENETKTASAERSTVYDARKFSHNLPGNVERLPFEPLPNISTGIFRCTDCEVIGPLAGKCAYYRNPEYYSFHHMSFFDLDLALLPSRKPQIKTGRKP